jgi:hypothetical protein
MERRRQVNEQTTQWPGRIPDFSILNFEFPPPAPLDAQS